VGGTGFAIDHALRPKSPVALSLSPKTAAMHGPEEPDEYHGELLGFTEGMRLGEYEIERVAMRDGAVRIEANSGASRFRVDILRRSRSPRGLGESADFSLYLCNQGSGEQTTDETCGIGVLSMA